MRRENLFHTRRTHLRRMHIPRGENLSVVLIFFALIALVAWLMTTRNNFDPTERDLPIELLGDNSRKIDIYNRPLKPWVEPGQQMAGAAFELGPFPAAVMDAEWQLVGRVKSFQPDNLYEKINGEAEKFIRQGFVELTYLRLRSASDAGEIAIELFDQGDLGGSLGIFSEHAAGRVVDNRDGVSFFTTEAGAIGRKDRYFFRIAGDSSSDAITNKANSLVMAFAQLGTASATARTRTREMPAGFTLLNQGLGIAETDIQFQEDNVFQYDFAKRFWFANAGLGGDAHLFVHIADSAAGAVRLVAALAEEHGYEYDELESDGAQRVFRHRYLGTYFVVAQRGPYVFGVENLPDAGAAAGLIARISESLDNDES